MSSLAPSSTKMKESTSIDPKPADNTCVVCFKNVKMYSIGECDHPVCYECSTRMRVLCGKYECPICRRDLSKVIFTNNILPYRQLEINNRSGLYDKKYRICFLSPYLQNAFYKLLENPCTRCNQRPFADFSLLKDHMRKEHELFYCDICTNNLKIFSFERKCYTRPDLGIHRRKGDPDNTSHRGHPLCQYCDCRFLDRDELWRHMRREHYYCHVCDADGSHQFYSDYSSMRAHFKKEHYLCEDGECAQEQFTSVFRSDIDLKAHITSFHGKSMGKLANKQARTLEFEFTLAPRNNRQGESSRSTHRPRDYDPQNEFDDGDHMDNFYISQNSPRVIIDAQNEQEFPSLGGNSSGFSIRPNVSIHTKSYGQVGLAKTKENFPALCGSSQETSPNHNVVNNNGYKQGTASALLKNSNNTIQKPSGVIIHVSNRPTTNLKKPEIVRTNSKDFPSLPNNSNKKSNLTTDFLPPSSAFNMSSVAAKHRNIVDSYESIAQETDTKLSLIQRDKPNTTKKSVENVPQLNSKNNFPALGASSSAITTPPSWITANKKQLIESRKSKVAPPPQSTNNNSKSISNKSDNSNKNFTKNSKKDKLKQKNKKHQELKSDLDSEPECVPSSTVLNAISAKHRQLVDSYESQAQTSVNKLTLVQRENENSSKKSNENVPKLNSTNNFPSLKSNVSNNVLKQSEDNNNHTTNMNKYTKVIQSDLTIKETSQTDVSENIEIDEKTNENNNVMNLTNENFPSLGIAITGPPPGFSSKSKFKIPPPGFNKVTLNSVAKPINNLTFTSSLGESYSIIPTHKYLPPINAATRNQELITHFQSTLKIEKVVEEFKQISQLFINGSYHALPYYEHCKSALNEKFDAIFPELLVLLPDINKQQELYLVHSQQSKQSTMNKKNKKSQNNVLEVCATCKQVLTNKDYPVHIQSHVLENGFPCLRDTLDDAALTGSK